MKAMALVSGGLDSMLAVRLMQKQGLEIVAVNFEIPFRQHNRDNTGLKNSLAGWGVELKTFDLNAEFLKIIQDPEHGFGANMNPCLDCKILMLTRARELMPGIGASFIITGEVLGQRPMSQHRQALELIEKKSGLPGLLVRPLSAQLLEETIPEKQGWVSRKELLNFNGRSRRPQIDLAGFLNIKEYAQPAGGCLLTDPIFSRRLKELLSHHELSLENIKLLKIGRHFRLGQKTRLVVGRNLKENGYLERSVRQGDYLFTPKAIAGPTSLARGEISSAIIKLASAITCYYCDLNTARSSEVIYRQNPQGEESILNTSPIAKSELEVLKI